MKNKFVYFLIIFSLLYTQDIYTEYLVIENDSIDIFSYQIPQNYTLDTPTPLLVAFHQWGGDHNSNYYTQFDEEANARNWIMLSPFGGSSNNYNHQAAQEMVKQEILWLIENYNIDNSRIYMVGGSMGGAAGAIYANNHLNPTEPMVAATASASGILDCERRAIEMDGNNSMIEWFGGNWDEVPFEYHRNSAVYFADSTQSMHYNLQYTPLYLDFGVTEPHRTHAEDLYNLLINYNNELWIDTEPEGSHGYSVFDENHVCNWLELYSLNFLNEPQSPHLVNVNLDETSRAYWLEPINQFISNEFIRINAEWHDSDGGNFELLRVNQFINSDSLVLYVLDEAIEEFNLILNTNLNIGWTGEIIDNEYELLGYSISNLNGGLPPCDAFEENIDSNNILWINCSANGFDAGEYIVEFFYNPPPSEFDDINLDGIWNVLDIVLIMNHILNISILEGWSLYNADFNSDEIIDVLDIVQLVNLILSN